MAHRCYSNPILQQHLLSYSDWDSWLLFKATTGNKTQQPNHCWCWVSNFWAKSSERVMGCNTQCPSLWPAKNYVLVPTLPVLCPRRIRSLIKQQLNNLCLEKRATKVSRKTPSEIEVLHVACREVHSWGPQTFTTISSKMDRSSLFLLYQELEHSRIFKRCLLTCLPLDHPYLHLFNLHLFVADLFTWTSLATACHVFSYPLFIIVLLKWRCNTLD